ncbi:hypothetical protein SBADM41S_05064 [Streptomyces badius]
MPEGPGLRLDTGYAGGDAIGVHYDPMIAKVIAHAPTRTEAVRLLARALERARVHGPAPTPTATSLLTRSRCATRIFAAARLDTGFYDRHLVERTAPAELGTPPRPPSRPTLAEAVPGCRTPYGRGSRTRHRSGPEAALAPHGPCPRPASGPGATSPRSPSASATAANPTAPSTRRHHRTPRTGIPQPYETPGTRVLAAKPDHVTLEVNRVTRHFAITAHGGRVHVDAADASYTFTALPRFTDPATHTAPGSLLAPMPGTVVRLADGLTTGVAVEAGQPLIWLEAMKMEHRILAPASGTLTALHAAPGHQVEVGALLAVVQAGPGRHPCTRSRTGGDRMSTARTVLETEEHQALRAAVAALGKRYGRDYMTTVIREGKHTDELRAEAASLTLPLVNLPEEYGGGRRRLGRTLDRAGGVGRGWCSLL